MSDITVSVSNSIETIIPINLSHEFPVNSRNLHTFLEIGRNHSTWIQDLLNKHQVFIENQDFIIFPETGKNLVVEKNDNIVGRPEINYQLSLDMAKHIAMMSTSLKGHEARQYFIDCEKKLKKIYTSSNKAELYRLLADIEDEKEKLAIAFDKAVRKAEKTEVLLEHVKSTNLLLEHTIDHHIQLPKSIPLESSDMGVYTNQEIEDLYKGHIALDKVKRCLEYVGHPTVSYQKEITTGRGLTKHTVSRIVKSYSKEVDINVSLEKAFYPDEEKISEYVRTTIRFTSKSMEVHNHPASQNYLIRIPKDTAMNLFDITDDFFVPSKDFYDYLDFVQKGELTIVTL